MLYLADTGILLRVLNRNDAAHVIIRRSLAILKAQGHTLVTASQNCAEFWNVSTRPASARGGHGLSIHETNRRLRLLEKNIPPLADDPATYLEWRQLVMVYAVHGVQVHDARLVAFMRVSNITNILTLNPSDFARYPFVTAITPEQVLRQANRI
jgi:predicted nucleic acid-binding protein